MTLSAEQLARFEEWRSTAPLSSALATPEEIFTAGYTAALRDSEAVGWISVKDRLPDTPIHLPELKMPAGKSLPPQQHSHTVLVATQGNASPMMCKLIRAADGTVVWDTYNSVVTHWMPLPAAPLSVS